MTAMTEQHFKDAPAPVQVGGWTPPGTRFTTADGRDVILVNMPGRPADRHLVVLRGGVWVVLRRATPSDETEVSRFLADGTAPAIGGQPPPPKADRHLSTVRGDILALRREEGGKPPVVFVPDPGPPPRAFRTPNPAGRGFLPLSGPVGPRSRQIVKLCRERPDLTDVEVARVIGVAPASVEGIRRRWITVPDLQRRVAELERENAELRRRLPDGGNGG